MNTTRAGGQKIPRTGSKCGDPEKGRAGVKGLNFRCAKGVGLGVRKTTRPRNGCTPGDAAAGGWASWPQRNSNTFRSWRGGYDAGMALTAARFQVSHHLEKIRIKHEPNTNQKQFRINESASKREPNTNHNPPGIPRSRPAPAFGNNDNDDERDQNLRRNRLALHALAGCTFLPSTRSRAARADRISAVRSGCPGRAG